MNIIILYIVLSFIILYFGFKFKLWVFGAFGGMLLTISGLYILRFRPLPIEQAYTDSLAIILLFLGLYVVLAGNLEPLPTGTKGLLKDLLYKPKGGKHEIKKEKNKKN